MTLLAQGTLPDVILLEDAEDLARWFVALGRTISPMWAEEVLDAANEHVMEGFF